MASENMIFQEISKILFLQKAEKSIVPLLKTKLFNHLSVKLNHV
jgi:hypothetical protein